ncbi:MAG: CDP-alcohol phosphatidyltransferase family protein [Deltaproteobacteria bacterium]|nr:CDP-alcohol phosphatidyltransferase family protein [Deltaproteobacteria bacterium]
MAREPVRHFSMIRDFQMADLFTLANGFGGMASVLCSMRYVADREPSALLAAFALLPVSLVCDVLDGRIARWQKRASLLGQELDSLADAVSFGVAPAALAFALGMRGGWDGAALVYFVGCGISRLARYNATAATLSDDSGKVRYFEGTPIPSSLLLVIALAVFARTGRIHEQLPLGALTLGPFVLHPLSLIFVLSGSAMISKTLRIPKP